MLVPKSRIMGIVRQQCTIFILMAIGNIFAFILIKAFGICCANDLIRNFFDSAFFTIAFGVLRLLLSFTNWNFYSAMGIIIVLDAILLHKNYLDGYDILFEIYCSASLVSLLIYKGLLLIWPTPNDFWSTVILLVSFFGYLALAYHMAIRIMKWIKNSQENPLRIT